MKGRTGGVMRGWDKSEESVERVVGRFIYECGVT